MNKNGEMELKSQQPTTGELVNIEDYAMSISSLVKQVNLIQKVMDEVMTDGEHYGKIPGTKKKMLYKSGAEKLCLVFRLKPDYEVLREVRDKDFVAYTIKCILTHVPTSTVVATGIGSCNSREAKYRYRYEEESTEIPVPKAYWTAREKGDSKEMKRLLGGDGFRAAKIDGRWFIARAVKLDHDNPWDNDNTIIKMACKRSLTAATLNATAASDIFTQDIHDDDIPPEDLGEESSEDKPEDPPSKTKTPKEKALETLRANIAKAGIDEADLAKMAGKEKIEELTVKAIEAMNANWARTVGKFMFKKQEGQQEERPQTEEPESKKTTDDVPSTTFVIPKSCIHEVMKDMIGESIDPAFCAAQECHKTCQAYQEWDNTQDVDSEPLE